jgi:uncharacterized membrane protein
MDSEPTDSTQIEVLRGILSEVQDLNSQLARIDERSEQNTTAVRTLREDRVAPLENNMNEVSNRSRRNSLILGAALTLLTILIGAGLTYGFSFL